MSKQSNLIKSVVKKNAAEKPTFGTDPRDPWSAKYNVNEDAILNKFLKSRGINPEHVTKDQKVAHSKMGEFLKWKRDHMSEQSTEPSPTIKRQRELERSKRHQTPIVKGVAEATDKKDGEYSDPHMAVNQLKTIMHNAEELIEMLGDDTDLPEWVESKITLAEDYIMTVANYMRSEMHESYGARADKLLARSHSAFYSGDQKTSNRAHKLFLRARDKHLSNPVNREKSINAQMSGATTDYADREKKYGPGKVRDSVELDVDVISENIKPGDFVKDTAHGQGHTYRVHKVEGNNLVVNRHHGKDSYGTFTNLHKTKARKVETPTNEEVVTEVSDATLSSYKEKAKKSADTLHAQGQYKKSANRWLNVMKATGKQIDKMQKENTLDPKAATEAPCDGANSSDDSENNKRMSQMTKSARIIKSIYKNKGIKEEIYDHEKEAKSVASYGKKPKLSSGEKKTEAVGGQPKAAAVMSGGTTLTGETRDTIEIDPMMKVKPGLIGQADKPKFKNK